ncbi:mitochondrial amidoxime-reducing component 1-like [Mya arenaria]|uniref:mitochondrial amidoxime-reducing component 1-like n=1 Tax=Mya arenaria TaxID=6604 RepID=UPI0022E978CC|nr:mitochondrial amidoxime-reducing component 1-like [Mya arenaria]
MTIMSMPLNNETLVALLVGSVVKFLGLGIISSRKRKELVGHVSRLYVFPLKSARELPGETHEVELTEYGIVYRGAGDRHWLVTRNGDMMTMKQSARLTLINTSLEADFLCLDAQGMDTLRLSLQPEVDPKRVSNVTVKETPLPALDLGDKAAAWVSAVLRMDGLRLHHAAPGLQRRLSCKVQKAWPTQIADTDEVAFQDFGHCMIMTESSLDELNDRLPEQMSAIPFRPNVIVDGSRPFDEDNWKEVHFGESAAVRYVDKCTRCLITTIHHETAEKYKDDQPLTELKKYRCMPPYGPKPCMGIHTVVLKPGHIRLGDPVYVLRR